jgi:hypothetical protein
MPYCPPEVVAVSARIGRSTAGRGTNVDLGADALAFRFGDDTLAVDAAEGVVQRLAVLGPEDVLQLALGAVLADARRLEGRRDLIARVAADAPEVLDVERVEKGPDVGPDEVEAAGRLGPPRRKAGEQDIRADPDRHLALGRLPDVVPDALGKHARPVVGRARAASSLGFELGNPACDVEQGLVNRDGLQDVSVREQDRVRRQAEEEGSIQARQGVIPSESRERCRCWKDERSRLVRLKVVRHSLNLLAELARLAEAKYAVAAEAASQPQGLSASSRRRKVVDERDAPHAGLDAKGSSFVACARDLARARVVAGASGNRSRPRLAGWCAGRVTNDDRPADELGPTLERDGDEEGVKIAMKDDWRSIAVGTSRWGACTSDDMGRPSEPMRGEREIGASRSTFAFAVVGHSRLR